MRAPIGDIVKLIGPHGAFGFFGDPATGVHKVPGIGVRRRRHSNQFGTQRPQRIHFFPALGFRHDDRRPVSLGIGNQRDADSGIACGALDNHAAGFEQAPLLRILDDEKSSPVFDRGARIGKLAFAIDIASGFLAGSVQPHQGRVSDQVERLWNNHHCNQIGLPKLLGKTRRLGRPQVVLSAHDGCAKCRDLETERQTGADHPGIDFMARPQQFHPGGVRPGRIGPQKIAFRIDTQTKTGIIDRQIKARLERDTELVIQLQPVRSQSDQRGAGLFIDEHKNRSVLHRYRA